MDRKGIIAIALAIITLLAWSQYYSRETQKLAEAQRVQKEIAEQKAAAEKAVADQAVAATPAAPGAPTTATPPPVEAQTEKLSTAEVEYSFTSLGGGIAHATLLKHLAEHGSQVELNTFGKNPIGAVGETLGEGTSLPYKMTANGDAGEVDFERTDARQLQISKKFILPKAGAREAYLSTLEVKFANLSPQAMPVPAYSLYVGTASPVHKSDQVNYTGFGWMHGGSFTFRDATSFSSGGIVGLGKTDAPVFQESTGDYAWAGTANQYFCTIATPREQKGGAVWAHRFAIDRELVAADGPVKTAPPGGPAATLNLVEGALVLAPFSLEPGKSQTVTFDLYTGPREYSRLVALGEGQDALMSFGMFRIVSKALLASLNWLYARLGSYGWAIVVLTLIIRSILWFPQNKATQSMKRMQALQPEMTALKEKYQDDPTRMNTELMKLYKTYQVNPVAGCLPMLVQFPVFFGFYAMLGRAVELRNAHFLGWVKDLSQPDTVWTFMGFPLNVLPLVMAATMVLQMRLSPKSGDPVQQRIFMFMPVIFIAFCYNYASALALYMSVQNVFSIAQLYLTRNQATPALQKVALPAKKRRS